MRTGRVIGGILTVVALVLPLVARLPAEASGVAKVKLVDNFHHGRVEVTVNEDIDRTLGYGDRTRYLSVTPSPSGNDVISVTWRKYPTCGIGDASQYFKAGHRYRLVVSVNDYGGRCGADGANNAKSPGFRVVKVD